MEKAGIDAEAYVAFDRDWYDGSIRGLDAEVARLFERLRALGLDRRTLVAFTSDHGEEFLEHGRCSTADVYGHQNNVPLILWQPGLVPADGAQVEDTVQSIDVMPTLLEASGVPVPSAAQGQGLWGLMTPAPGTVRAAERGHRGGIGEGPDRERLGDAAAPRDGVPGPRLRRLQAHREPGPEGRPRVRALRPPARPPGPTDLASQKPEVVERLAHAAPCLAQGRRSGPTLKPDAEAASSLSRDELERLRALGYIQ